MVKNIYNEALSKVKLNETQKQSLKELYQFKEYSGKGEKMVKNRRSFRYVVAAVLVVALMVCGVATTGIFTQKENRDFALCVNAKELTNKNAVLLDTSEQAKAFGSGWKATVGGVDYYVSFMSLNCKGKDIETVKYSINKGAFRIISSNENDTILSSEKYQGPSFEKNMYEKEHDNFYYCSSFTVDYNKQPTLEMWENDQLMIDIIGKTKHYDDVDNDYLTAHKTDITPDEANYDSIRKQKIMFDKCFENLIITCTVTYKDGSTSSKNIRPVAEIKSVKDELDLPEDTKNKDYALCLGYTLN